MVKNRSYFSLVLALLLSLVLASAALARPLTPHQATYSGDHSIGMFQDDGGDGGDDGGDDSGTGGDTSGDIGDGNGNGDNGADATIQGTNTPTTTQGTQPGADPNMQQGTQPGTDPNMQQQGTQPGTQQQAPGTLPQTGGESTPWAMLLLIAVGGLVLFSGLGLAFNRRPH